MTHHSEWSPRAGHACICYESSLYVIGGEGAQSRLSDVWHSDDGAHWVQAGVSGAVGGFPGEGRSRGQGCARPEFDRLCMRAACSRRWSQEAPGLASSGWGKVVAQRYGSSHWAGSSGVGSSRVGSPGRTGLNAPYRGPRVERACVLRRGRAGSCSEEEAFARRQWRRMARVRHPCPRRPRVCSPRPLPCASQSLDRVLRRSLELLINGPWSIPSRPARCSRAPMRSFLLHGPSVGPGDRRHGAAGGCAQPPTGTRLRVPPGQGPGFGRGVRWHRLPQRLPLVSATRTPLVINCVVSYSRC